MTSLLTPRDFHLFCEAQNLHFSIRTTDFSSRRRSSMSPITNVSKPLAQLSAGIQLEATDRDDVSSSIFLDRRVDVKQDAYFFLMLIRTLLLQEFRTAAHDLDQSHIIDDIDGQKRCMCSRHHDLMTWSTR